MINVGKAPRLGQDVCFDGATKREGRATKSYTRNLSRQISVLPASNNVYLLSLVPSQPQAPRQAPTLSEEGEAQRDLFEKTSPQGGLVHDPAYPSMQHTFSRSPWPESLQPPIRDRDKTCNVSKGLERKYFRLFHQPNSIIFISWTCNIIFIPRSSSV